MKPKSITLIGSSHARRFEDAFKKLKGSGSNFVVKAYCKPGANFSKLIWPSETELSLLTEDDFIICFPFGNDVFEPLIATTGRGPNKVIHLTKLIKKPDTHILELCDQLSKKLVNTKAKVFLLSNFLRHLHCCPKHKYPGIVKHQNHFNKLILNFFRGTKYNVIRQEALVFKRSTEGKNIHKYAALQPDSVHFSPILYSKMAEKLLALVSDGGFGVKWKSFP